MTSTSGSQLGSIQIEVSNINQSKNGNTVIIKPSKTYFSDVQSRLKPYKALPYKFVPALEAVSRYVRSDMIKRSFDMEGPGWAPLAKRTQMERELGGFKPQHPILKRTGDLYRELVEKSHPNHIEVITTGKRARIEIGGSSQKFIQNQMGVKATRLPARPMIPGTGRTPITSRDRINISSIIKKAITAKSYDRI